jgi:hypothetical protein
VAIGEVSRPRFKIANLKPLRDPAAQDDCTLGVFPISATPLAQFRIIDCHEASDAGALFQFLWQIALLAVFVLAKRWISGTSKIVVW